MEGKKTGIVSDLFFSLLSRESHRGLQDHKRTGHEGNKKSVINATARLVSPREPHTLGATY